MNFKSKLKKVFSGTLSLTVFSTLLLNFPVKADDINEKYPYTMFAASDIKGAININANNFCANGNIATNGTIVSSGNVSVNGTRTENANEEMLYIQKKLNYSYFSGNDVETYVNDYNFEALNININNPMDVNGTIEMTGNINLNSGIKALEDVILNGEVKNTNNSVIFSETGDININTSNTNFSGLIYAPYGDVVIDTDNLNLNNVIVIGQTITIDCPSINANYNDSMAELIGTESDIDVEIYAMGDYNSETNSIDIEWFSNYANSSYEVWVSDDNVEYTSVAVISDTTEYQYPITEDFETKYFKVSLTTNYSEYIESMPFVVINSEEGYSVDFLDSDSDELPDIFELEIGTDVNNPDSDEDGLTDYQEVYLTGTDPTVYDSVTEGVSDSDADSDNDGLSNIYEIEIDTDPQNNDTDNDGLSDYDELYSYGTDPLNPDSDGDSLKDSDELHIGLDPTNPETFGVSDAEYKIEQTISADSEVLSRINIVENPYRLSIDIKAAGYVEGNLTAKKTSYSKAIQNYSMFGVAPELTYTNADSIETVKLKFEISSEYIENSLNIFSEEELTGIKRLNVFKYFEDLNMLLPIETFFDVENNVIYTNVDELGTYCIMDMELWLNSFDVPEEAYQSTPMLMSLLPENVATEFATEDSIMTFDCEIEDMALTGVNESENIAAIMSATQMLMFKKPTSTVTPIDVAFLLQSSGQRENTFVSQKTMIIYVMEELIKQYGKGNVRFCIVTYNLTGAEILKSNNNDIWFTNLYELSETLSNISYTETLGYTDRGNAFCVLQNDVNFRENASKFIFQLMNGSTNVGSMYFDQINTCSKLGINYSELMPSGYYYISDEYEKQVNNAIASTNGMNEIYSANSAIKVYNHICTYIAPPQIVFNAIVPIGWKEIQLNGILDENNGVNSDEDNLTDWEEVDTEKIRWATDGSIILPTIQECINYATKSYAETGLSRFKSAQYISGMPSSDFEKYLDYVLNNTFVLPIHSDPSDKDTDGDGLWDGTTQYHIFGEIQKAIAPSDPDPMMYTGPENLWINHIKQLTSPYNYIPTQYAEDTKEKPVENSAFADFIVKSLLKHREGINKKESFIKKITPKIQKMLESHSTIGAYLLKFLYDENYSAYHSQVNTWQRKYGYNELYDDFFRMGSSMNYGRVDFNVDEDIYTLWTWKGDYWAFESGAEVGLYKYNKELSEKAGSFHYDAVDFEVPMTLSLYNYDNGKYRNVFHWVPEDKQWWITGFNPFFNEPNPNIMVSVASVDLKEYPDFYDALKNTKNNKYHDQLNKEHLIFDDTEKTVWIQWYNKEAA